MYFLLNLSCFREWEDERDDMSEKHMSTANTMYTQGRSPKSNRAYTKDGVQLNHTVDEVASFQILMDVTEEFCGY